MTTLRQGPHESQPDDRGISLTWLGQAGFTVSAANFRLAIDPFLSSSPRRLTEPPIPAQALIGTDLVLCTHEHADHMDLPTLRFLADHSPDTLFAAPEPIVHLLVAAGIAQERIRAARDGEVLTDVGVPIRVIPAKHGTTMDDAYGFGRADGELEPARFVGYVITMGGVTIYHAGDTVHWPGQDDLLRKLSVDVALLPINGRDADREGRGIVGNLDPREAALLASSSGAELIVPMHWDAINGNLGVPSEVLTAVHDLGLPISVLLPRCGFPFWYVAGGVRVQD